MPVQIDVVDEAVHPDNGFLVDQRRWHPNAVHSHDVMSLVQGVLGRATSDTISRLRIFGHGRSGQQGVGGGIQTGHPQVSQRIGVDSLADPLPGALWNRGVLAALCGRFTPDALVELHGCHVGARWAGEILCWQLAQLWQVRVRAGIADQVADAHDRFEGRFYVEADGRPGTLQPLGIYPRARP